MAAARRLLREAQRRFYVVCHRRIDPATKVLFAPTSALVDVQVGWSAWQLILETAKAEFSEQTIANMIQSGPPGQEIVWPVCQTGAELTASIARNLSAAPPTKRIRATEATRRWIQEALSHHPELGTKSRLGGFAAIGAGVVHALGGLGTMFLSDPISSHALELICDQVHIDPIYGPCQSVAKYRQAHGTDPGSAPNFALQWSSQEDPLGTSADMLICASERRPPFSDIAPAKLRALGADHHAVVVSGLQRIITADECRTFARALHELHSGGAAVALLYTDLRADSEKWEIYRSIIDSPDIAFLGLNAKEASAIVGDIETMGLLRIPSPFFHHAQAWHEEIIDHNDNVWGQECQEPTTLLRNALTIQEICKAPLVRVRGDFLDIMVTDFTVQDPNCLRDHLIVSRNLGTLKVAHEDGIIDGPEDIGPLSIVPHGPHVAALKCASEAIARWYKNEKWCANENDAHGSSGQISLLESQGWIQLPDNRMLFIVPATPLLDRTGGVVSAGDTKDSSFIALEAMGVLREAREFLERRRLTTQAA